MLSYRHAFHAGNHADILKHSVLMRILGYMGQKDKPFTCIDTHAGAGIYDLDSEWARKTGEAAEGIGLLLDRADIPAFFLPYTALCRSYRDSSRQYPGSPELERVCSRPQDSIILMEKHPAEIGILREHLGGDPRIHIHQRDGFSGLAAICPPDPRRGMALVDPSYETSGDYELAAETLIAAHRRWPAGILVLWYPILGRRRDEIFVLKDRFRGAGIPGILCAELLVDESDDGGFGLAGSGLLIIQGPWPLAGELETALPWLAGVLGRNDCGSFSVEWLSEQT